MRRENEIKNNIEIACNWGEEVGINDPWKQLLYCNSELGELSEAYIKPSADVTNKCEGVYDGVGDTIITFTVLSNIIGVTDYVKKGFEAPLISGYEPMHCLTNISGCINDIGDLFAINSFDHAGFNIREAIGWLRNFCNAVELDDQFCFSYALNIVTNRKGKTINGVRIKEEDLK